VSAVVRTRCEFRRQDADNWRGNLTVGKVLPPDRWRQAIQKNGCTLRLKNSSDSPERPLPDPKTEMKNLRDACARACP